MAVSMQRLHELRQYLIDLNTIPRLSREEIHELISRLAARLGKLSPEQTSDDRTGSSAVVHRQAMRITGCESVPAITMSP